MFTTEYLGPILAVHVYDDRRYDPVSTRWSRSRDYALTGAVIASDRTAIAWATERLRTPPGLYVNDKPTVAVSGSSRAAEDGPRAPTTRPAQRRT